MTKSGDQMVVEAAIATLPILRARYELLLPFVGSSESALRATAAFRRFGVSANEAAATTARAFERLSEQISDLGDNR